MDLSRPVSTMNSARNSIMHSKAKLDRYSESITMSDNDKEHEFEPPMIFGLEEDDEINENENGNFLNVENNKANLNINVLPASPFNKSYSHNDITTKNSNVNPFESNNNCLQVNKELKEVSSKKLAEFQKKNNNMMCLDVPTSYKMFNRSSNKSIHNNNNNTANE